MLMKRMRSSPLECPPEEAPEKRVIRQYCRGTHLHQSGEFGGLFKTELHALEGNLPTRGQVPVFYLSPASSAAAGSKQLCRRSFAVFQAEAACSGSGTPTGGRHGSRPSGVHAPG